jgi:sterol desaturase/sphingolipid hydroxylase (fatty acid hydroxylase superfamily)
MKRALVLLGGFVALLWLEKKRPLRVERESKARRDLRNLAIAGTAGVVAGALEAPASARAMALVERRQLGLVRLIQDERLRDVLAVLLLDYTMYWWHVGTHRVPWLWRMHRVHHADRDLDSTTALRFHFAEMTVTVPFRVAQILLIGVSPRALLWWQTGLMVSILFHHSNWRLPAEVDGALSRLIVTPRLHGIHHSRKQEEMDSNWSSGLSVWDRLHGSYRDDVPQEAIDIGVPGFDEEPDVRLAPMLAAGLQ